MLYISEEEIKQLLNWHDTFEAVKAALESTSKKRTVQNPRGHTKWSPDSVLLTMPAFLNDAKFGALSCKLATVCPNNEKLEHPLPTINAHITLFDEKTGALKAVMGGGEITKWRTAAASAVATKFLMKNKSMDVLAILGAGVQGRIHAIAFHHLFNFREIRIWNRNQSKAENLVRELSKSFPGKKFKCFLSNQDCVNGADVIVTATFSTQPLVLGGWVKDGVHINAVGVNFVNHGELSESIYLNGEVYVDHMEGAMEELADLVELGVKFRGEVGSVVSGDLAAPPSGKVSVFQSLGMAVEDGAVARLVYDLYKTRNK